MLKTKSIVSLCELAALFGLVMLYVWWLIDKQELVWILLVVLIFVTQLIHRQRFFEGLSAGNFGATMKFLLPWVAGLLSVLFPLAFVLDKNQASNIGGFVRNLRWYIFWALAQQYLLNSYLATKLEVGFVGIGLGFKPNLVALIAAVIFAAVHLPNPFLFPVALVGGFIFTRVYLKYREIYSLAIVHAVIGCFLLSFFPVSLTFGLAIGPKFFEFFPR